MRSLVTVSLLVLFTLGCTSAEPANRSDAKPVAEICSYLLDVTNRELKSTGDTLPDEAQAMFQENCVEEFERTQRRMSAEEYDAHVACVMATERIAEYEQCNQKK